VVHSVGVTVDFYRWLFEDPQLPLRRVIFWSVVAALAVFYGVVFGA
jgi:hypothetical protein